MDTRRRLYWKAVYDDKSFLLQYEEQEGKRVEYKYADINRDRLRRFDLLDTVTHKTVHSLWLNDGQRLIYRRRTIKPFIVTLDRPEQVIYLVGYQHTVMANAGPRTFIVINYLYEDGSIALDGSRNNLELLPDEI